MKYPSLVAAMLLGSLVTGAVAASCTSSGIVGGECRSGLANCDNHCVDLNTDPLHCGGCGITCPAGVVCLAGICSPNSDAGLDVDSSSQGDAPDDHPSDETDASPDHDVSDSPTDVLHDTSLDRNDTGPVDGDANAEADVDPCIPPFDTKEQCGDCYTSCGGATPLCAPVDGSYACVPTCIPPLTECNGQCVDLDSDPRHCGRCGRQCPSGLCVDAKCVGSKAGHVVMMCMDFEETYSTAAQTVVLGNAVLLPPLNPVTVLGFTEHTDPVAQNNVDRSIQWAANSRGRQVDISHLAGGEDIPDLLIPSDFQVLVIYDQPKAPAGRMAELASLWNVALRAFIRTGGVVVILNGGGGSAQMTEFITGANLFPMSGQADVTNSQLYNRSPADAIGVNVITPFLALPNTCTFSALAPPDAFNVFVVTDTEAGDGLPVVIHALVPP